MKRKSVMRGVAGVVLAVFFGFSNFFQLFNIQMHRCIIESSMERLTFESSGDSAQGG